MSKRGPNLSSNEEVSPGSDHVPRVPATKRDFGKLPVTMRTEKGSPPNLVRAEKDSGPQGAHGRERPSRTLLPTEPRKPIERAVLKRLRSHEAKANNR